MPITQERFLSIINASADVLDAWDTLRDLTRAFGPAIADINSARAKYPEAAPALDETLALLTRIHSTIAETNAISANHRAALAVEREHFRKTERRNQKMADIQRRARINKGGSPLTRQQGPVHPGLSAKASYGLKPKLGEFGDVNAEPVGYDVEQDPGYIALHEQYVTDWNQKKENTDD